MRSDPDNFESISRHLGAMMDELLKGDFFRNAAPDTWQPAINIYEAPSRYLVCVDLAGMDRRKIDVEVRDAVLYIRGDRPRPHDADIDETLSVHVMEIESGRFHRKIPVPGDVSANDIDAHYRKGYLWIVMPRKETDPQQEGR